MENENNFKKEIIKLFKQGIIKMIIVFLFLFFYYGMTYAWLWSITNLIEKFPERKTDINWLGIAGLGYAVISFFGYVTKVLDRKNES